MYYKNYMLNYMDILDTLILVELDEDVTNQKPSGEFILEHTKRLIHFPREWMDNYNNYLEDNGLFLGIFPPQMVQNEINEFWKTQNKWMEETLKKAKILTTTILSENKFKEYFESKYSLETVLDLLNDINYKRINFYNLEPINIEKEYKEYLIKYWGAWQIDE